MTSLSEAFQAKHTPEGKRKEIIQIQQPVASALEWSCDEAVQPAENAVFQLYIGTIKFFQTASVTSAGFESDGYSGKTDAECISVIAGAEQSVYVSVSHFQVGKADGNVQREVGRFGKPSHGKDCEPPVCSAEFRKLHSFVKE